MWLIGTSALDATSAAVLIPGTLSTIVEPWLNPSAALNGAGSITVPFALAGIPPALKSTRRPVGLAASLRV